MANIVFVSHTFMGGPFVVGSHHLATQLSMIGHRVLHISTPVTLLQSFKRDKVSKYRVQRAGKSFVVNESLTDYTPLSIGLPWKIAGGLYQKLQVNLLLKPALGNIISYTEHYFNNESVTYLILDQPTMVGIEKELKADCVVYRATDLNSVMMDSQSVLYAEKEIIASASGLIGTSSEVLHHISELKPDLPTLLLENGVDYTHFESKQERPEAYKDLTGSIAVYAGAIDYRLDLKALYDLAVSLTYVNIVIIGPTEGSLIHEIERLQGLDNVYVLGSVSYEVLPAYLQHADIGLLPLSDHEANRGRSPMKLYEYLTAGLPIVSRAVLELQKRGLEHAFFYDEINPIHEVVEYVLQLELCPEEVAAGTEEASWERKTRTLETFLKQIH